MAPPSEQQILDGKYRLVRKLEDGGMGSVWFAEHLSLHSPVAVKLIAKEVADTEEGLQRFLREARMAASLRSPHVVQILDYGVDAGTPYIVMELLDGESLADRLSRRGRLTPRETELVLRHVSRAVGRAHDAGIVHRDLKPSNIFLIENDDEEMVKLLDFGIAKATIEALSASIASNTRTGAFLGTPFYVSPEQAEGIKSLDHRTDIWAMGVIAFECMIGRQPFMGDTFGSLVLSICSRPMPVPSQQGSVPAGFDAWFARACARDPDLRFQTAREAAAELRRVIEQVAPEIKPAMHQEAAPALGSENPSYEPFHARLMGTSSLGNTTAAASSSAVTERMKKTPRLRWSAIAALGAAMTVAASLALRGGEDTHDVETSHAAALPAPEPVPARAGAERETVAPIPKATTPSDESAASKPLPPNVALVVADPLAAAPSSLSPHPRAPLTSRRTPTPAQEPRAPNVPAAKSPAATPAKSPAAAPAKPPSTTPAKPPAATPTTPTAAQTTRPAPVPAVTAPPAPSETRKPEPASPPPKKVNLGI